MVKCSLRAGQQCAGVKQAAGGVLITLTPRSVTCWQRQSGQPVVCQPVVSTQHHPHTISPTCPVLPVLITLLQGVELLGVTVAVRHCCRCCWASGRLLQVLLLVLVLLHALMVMPTVGLHTLDVAAAQVGSRKEHNSTAAVAGVRQCEANRQGRKYPVPRVIASAVSTPGNLREERRCLSAREQIPPAGFDPQCNILSLGRHISYTAITAYLRPRVSRPSS